MKALGSEHINAVGQFELDQKGMRQGLSDKDATDSPKHFWVAFQTHEGCFL